MISSLYHRFQSLLYNIVFRDVHRPVSVAAGANHMLWTSDHDTFVTYVDEAQESQRHLSVGMHLGRVAYIIEPTVHHGTPAILI